MKFSTQLSEVQAAARVKGPEAADIQAFQQLLSNSPWTHHLLKTCRQHRLRMHTLFSRQGETTLAK